MPSSKVEHIVEASSEEQAEQILSMLPEGTNAEIVSDGKKWYIIKSQPKEPESKPEPEPEPVIEESILKPIEEDKTVNLMQPKDQINTSRIKRFKKRILGNKSDILEYMIWDKGIFIHDKVPNFKTNSTYKRTIDNTEYSIEENDLYSKKYSTLSIDWFKKKLGRIGTTYFVILNKENGSVMNSSQFPKTKIDGRNLYLAFTEHNLRRGWFNAFKEAFHLNIGVKYIVIGAVAIGIIVGIIYYLMQTGVFRGIGGA